MIYFSISYKKFLLLSIISTVSSFHTSKEKYISAAQSDILNTTHKSNFESTAELYSDASEIEKVKVSTTTKKYPKLLNDKCSFQGSCNYIPPDRNWFCQCDAKCQVYNDCCIDPDKADFTQNQQKYECLSGTSDATINAGYFVSVSCPTDYGNQTVIDRCNRVSLVTDGTFVVSNESHIFRNEYCAYCNDVTNFTSFDLQLYNLRIDVDEYRKVSSELTGQEKLNYTLQLSDYLQIIPPGTVTRFCMTGLHDRKDFACQLYVNPVIAVDTKNITRLYRNIFCVIPSDVKYIRCLPRIFDIPNVDVFTIHKLSVLFSFKTVIEKTDSIDCGVWSQEVSICMDRFVCIYIAK